MTLQASFYHFIEGKMLKFGGGGRWRRFRLLDALLLGVAGLMLILPSFVLGQQSASVPDLLQRGIDYHNGMELDMALKVYNEVLALTNGENPDALHLKGLVHYSLSNSELAKELILEAIARGGDKAVMGSNLGEVYRTAGDYKEALKVLEAAASASPLSPLPHYNLAQVHFSMNSLESATSELLKVLELDPSNVKATKELAKVMHDAQNFEASSSYYAAALSRDAGDVESLMGLGTSLQRLGDLSGALQKYEVALSIDPSNKHALMNIGVIRHSTGDMDSAIDIYRRCLEHDESDVYVLNNLGAALVTIGNVDEGVQIFDQAMAIDPNIPSVLINLGTHYNNDGNLADGNSFLQKAFDITLSNSGRKDVGLLIRQAIALPPVPSAAASPSETVDSFLTKIADVALYSLSEVPESSKMLDPVSSIERVHFYLPYLGQPNDRISQTLINQMYRAACRKDLIALHPRISSSRLPWPLPSPPTRKLRIGFISKFFGPFEPHGLLLEGIIKYLPSAQFHTVLCPITTPDGDAAPYLTEAADEVVQLSLDFHHARQTLMSANLDVAIFADMNSEPMNHFLGYSRFAPVQALFWGNPITSGNPAIDYFISADRMEDPFRTVLEKDVYSEQVVLLDGQGIWYSRFDDLETKYYPSALKQSDRSSLADFEIPQALITPQTTIYLCAQSLFKLSRRFDEVVKRVLEEDDDGVIVFTKGRRPSWTARFKERLSSLLPPHLLERVILIPRVSSIDFPSLIRLSDVMLHPFPFGGSRTSLDGLEANIPVVTYPQKYLRGRMAVSFFASMGIWECCVANSVDEYVHKAVKLGKDKGYRAQVKTLIASRLDRVYEDMQTVEEWTKWLRRATNLPEVNFDDDATSDAKKGLWQEDANLENVIRIMQQQALADFRESIRNSGTDEASRSYNQLETYLSITANAYNANGDLNSALDQLELLKLERPTDSKVRNDIGAVLQQMTRLVEAGVELEQAIMLDKTNIVAMNNLGVVEKDKGNSEVALEWFLKAARCSKSRELGAVLTEKEDISEATKGLAVEVSAYHLCLLNVSCAANELSDAV